MSEDENVSVEEEIPQAPAEAEEPQNVTDQRKESAADSRKRNDLEYNWAEARRRQQELERQNQELREQFAQIKQSQTPKVDDEIDRLGDDDIITKASAKKLAEKMARQIAQEVIKERENASIPERIKHKFPDYDNVVTQENIELLKRRNPELAMSLASTPDAYAQAVAVYDALKMIGGQSMPDSRAQDKKRAQENSQKPVSVNAASKSSALGNAHLFENGLTPELKKSLWQEMQTAMKGA